jgi:inorganic pyrophosphatase
VETVGLDEVNLLHPLEFGGLILGAMLPYWFSALTMRSVGKAALAMVAEVRRQFRDIRGLAEGHARPDYSECVRISTTAAIKVASRRLARPALPRPACSRGRHFFACAQEMLAPSAIVIFTPVVTGYMLGVTVLAGVLMGALVSGVQMAVSSSNTGGAWDNAKKYIESGRLGGRGSAEHKAAVVGDTVGDPLKDTSGPSLNILIKLMAIISLVFAPSLPREGLLFRIF